MRIHKCDRRKRKRQRPSLFHHIYQITDRIERLLIKYKVKIIQINQKAQQPLQVGNRQEKPTVCTRVPTNTVFMWQTKLSIKTRIKELKSNCRLAHTEKSAIADHILNQKNHEIRFQDTYDLIQAVHVLPQVLPQGYRNPQT